MAGIYYIPVHCRQYQVRGQVSVVGYKEMASLRCVHRVNVFDGQVIFYFSEKKSLECQFTKDDIIKEFSYLVICGKEVSNRG